MNEFIMLVGMPGAGKSTIAEEYVEHGFTVHSPDIIRNKLNLHSLDDTAKVFDIMHDNMIEDMKCDKDIIYDSTNLSRRRRMTVLNLIKEFGYHKTCIALIVPIEVCKERNSKRTGHSKVSNYEYEIAVNIFNLPTFDEGWDNIKIDIQDSRLEII